MKKPFIITIDDSFCTYSYEFKPKKVDTYSIKDIVTGIEKHFKTKLKNQKFIK